MIVASLKQKLIESMKAKNSLEVGVIRFLLSAIQNKEIELRPRGVELSDEYALKVIKKQIKQRKDSIDGFTKGGRQDLVEKETNELGISQKLYTEFGGNLEDLVYVKKVK